MSPIELEALEQTEAVQQAEAKTLRVQRKSFGAWLKQPSTINPSDVDACVADILLDYRRGEELISRLPDFPGNGSNNALAAVQKKYGADHDNARTILNQVYQSFVTISGGYASSTDPARPQHPGSALFVVNREGSILMIEQNGIWAPPRTDNGIAKLVESVQDVMGLDIGTPHQFAHVPVYTKTGITHFDMYAAPALNGGQPYHPATFMPLQTIVDPKTPKAEGFDNAQYKVASAFHNVLF